MVWRMFSPDPEPIRYKPQEPALVLAKKRAVAHSARLEATSRTRVDGDLVTLVGKAIERIGLDNDVLSVNLADNRVLLRYKKNDRGFDQYIGLPFTKGVTERVTGRTQLLLGTPVHHIEAMQNQFSGALWTEDEKNYGDTIRWINVGDLKTGFIGLDYNPNAAAGTGVAQTKNDVQFLANMLLEFGYDSAKRLFLFKPPYLTESEEGKTFRTQGYNTLNDYAR